MSTTPSQKPRRSDRRILPRQSVTMLSDPVRVGETSTNPDAVGIELIREGNVTREIHVRCPCGQTMVLECDYLPDNAPE